MEEIIESTRKESVKMDYRVSFETFKSNICHRVRDEGDLAFIADIFESDEIRKLFNRKWYPEALYLLAIVDYLSRENELPLCSEYKDIRASKLQAPIFPASVIVASAALKDDKVREESCAAAIPEFARFNIIEGEVRNVI